MKADIDKKICVECGNEFIPTKGRHAQVACKNCTQIHRNRKNREWTATHKDELLEYRKKYRARKRNDDTYIPPSIIVSTLDNKVKEARAQGITYAEMQRRQTLGMIGRVQI